MFQDDLDMEHEAARIAGSSVLLRAVPKVQQRIPGLAGTKILRRLDYFDFTQPNRNLSSNVFNISNSRFNADFKRLKPAAKFDGFWRETLLKPYYDHSYRREVLKELKSTRGGSYRAYGDFGKKALAREAATPAEDRRIAGFAVESNALQTRQEMLAHLAGIDAKRISPDFNFTLAEMRAFIDIHEHQHARSLQVWAEDPSFLDKNKKPEIVQEFPEYERLWRKTSQASALDDLYIAYLEEDMSDTVGILHHLKAGGHVDLTEGVADARVIGHVGDASEKYASYLVLDEIAKDVEQVRARVIGKTPEEIDRMSAKLVGTFAMDRDIFYAQAMAGGLHMASKGREERDRYLEELGHDIVHEHVNSWKPIDYTAAHELGMQRLSVMLDREDQAYARLCVPEEELAYEDHKIEVLASIRHAQEMHPEFQGPTGAKHLLGIRQRMVLAQTGVDGLNEDDIEICDELGAYFDEQQQEQEQGATLEQEVDHERS